MTGCNLAFLIGRITLKFKFNQKKKAPPPQQMFVSKIWDFTKNMQNDTCYELNKNILQ